MEKEVKKRKKTENVDNDEKVTKTKNVNVKEETIKTDVEKENDKQDKKLNKSILLIIIGIVILILIIFGITKFVSEKYTNQDIKSVKRVLKTKYSYIDCIDSSCNGFVAIKGDKLTKSTVELLNADGKKVASYKEKYDSSDKNVRTPYQLTDKYFIMKTINSDDLTATKYSIMNKKGKELYTTSNELNVLNENFVLMEDEKTSKYSILDTKGKELYNNISDIDIYLNGKYISFQIDDDYTILDEDGDKILDNYKIAKAVKKDSDENVILYFIVKDIKSATYYYYDIDKSEIVGDGFLSYANGEKDGELIITKKVNDKNEKYTLSKNGKQTKIENQEDNSDIVSSIKEKIDTDLYYLYSVSVTKKGQKNVLVDNKSEKSFGILNLDTNKYTSIYEYNSERTSFYSTVDKLNDDDSDLYLKISCSKNYCNSPKTLIYDFEHMTEIYKVNDGTLIISDYIQYEDGYKVVRYSSVSSNSDYKGKYVLYDKNNKELFKSSNRIVLVDKELTFGNKYSYSLTLYSVKQKKALNEDSEAASLITISDEKLYKYTDKNGNTVIYNMEGKKVISANSDYIKYSNTSIVYLEDEKIVMYDVKKAKTRTYTLKENEKLNDSLGDIIPPYRGTIFINNSTDKYIKVINSKGKTIKKIKNVEISTVETTEKNNNVFIIVKGSGKTGNLYGLYVAK